jgi:hypothetical protein
LKTSTLSTSLIHLTYTPTNTCTHSEEDVRTLPLGVSLPLLDAMHECRVNAPEG